MAHRDDSLEVSSSWSLLSGQEQGSLHSCLMGWWLLGLSCTRAGTALAAQGSPQTLESSGTGARQRLERRVGPLGRRGGAHEVTATYAGSGVSSALPHHA